MRPQLLALLVGVLYLVSVQAQHHTNATYSDGCYFLNDELVGCIKTQTQPCDNFWFFQLSAPVTEDTFFVIGSGYVYFDMDFLQCFSSADGEKCFCLSFAGNTFDGENVHTTPGITANCNNLRIHTFEPTIIEGTSCGSAFFHFPCTQQFWDMPLMQDDEPPTGNGQVIFAKDAAAKERFPTIVLPATSGSGADEPGSGANGEPGSGNGYPTDPIWYTNYVDVSPSLVDELLLFFSEHPEYPLGDYLHVEWECLYLSAPDEFAQNYQYAWGSAERIEIYCPSIVMDTCSGDIALESRFGLLLQTMLTPDGANYVQTEISGVTIAAHTELLEVGENYVGASVTILFMNSLYEADIHLAFTYPHCGFSNSDCPNLWGSYSYNVYYSSLVSDFFSWIANSPPPSSDHHHHHHHHKSPSPSPVTASFSSFTSLFTTLETTLWFSSSAGESDANLAWLSVLVIFPVLLIVIVVFIVAFALIVKKLGVFQKRRELDDGENVYSMMVNQ